MEIYGNPFSGYGTLYYQKIIEQLANINGDYLVKNLPDLNKNGHYSSNCNSHKCSTYKYSDKGNVNCCSQISIEGLVKRVKNKEQKRIIIQNEKNIQQAFSLKIKSKRWAKRHHNYVYSKHL
jgi:hypothetical protein